MGGRQRETSGSSVASIKLKVCQLAALTDRGKLQDPLVSDEGLYAAERETMVSLLELLIAKGRERKQAMSPVLLEGEWELVYSTKQLFRSSPFFQAIERAYADPTKSELFFKLHELQTCSWGASQIGRVAQTIDLQAQTLLSSFDTVLFPLTTIPLIGWFKLLPTFGGRVLSLADGLTVSESAQGTALRLEYAVAKTSFKRLAGLKTMPLLGAWLENKQFPTKEAWNLLPWNWSGSGPRCLVEVVYLDEDFRIVREGGGEDGGKDGWEERGYFVYARPVGFG
ncbi:hypothetical protein NSK_005692 [Nannochloropsis salina CCMP1776]|uniref:Plastid lipid-associated protein/fibrillin conserved domain-containing protein n=2 Tax=Nannochloropsis salina CCMP1776 TaxID=1027361 RepID=A0A4D9CZF7_9STRA|nr:hypothetical protein NSK_005692 [Nannochloropsis salina CCMP1776]|eukprot:TFJ83003.1 hypothetical protein NSK_005692 [Nannochloropsis salina CCMP1776]